MLLVGSKGRYTVCFVDYTDAGVRMVDIKPTAQAFAARPVAAWCLKPSSYFASWRRLIICNGNDHTCEEWT